MDIPTFQILNPSHAFLRIRDHLSKEICEAGAAKLCSSRAVEVAVVDGFAIRGDAETWGGRGAGSRLWGWQWDSGLRLWRKKGRYRRLPSGGLGGSHCGLVGWRVEVYVWFWRFLGGRHVKCYKCMRERGFWTISILYSLTTETLFVRLLSEMIWF